MLLPHASNLCRVSFPSQKCICHHLLGIALTEEEGDLRERGSHHAPVETEAFQKAKMTAQQGQSQSPQH